MKKLPPLLLLSLCGLAAGVNDYESRYSPDTNKDFRVTSIELAAWIPKAAQFYAENVSKAPRNGIVKMCAEYDRDGNNHLDEDEQKALREHCQALANYYNDQIIKFDQNRNGRIDPDAEARGVRNRFSNMIFGDGLRDMKAEDLGMYKNRRLDDIYD